MLQGQENVAELSNYLNKHNVIHLYLLNITLYFKLWALVCKYGNKYDR